MTRFNFKLGALLDPQPVLAEVVDSISGMVRVDRAGIAVHDVHDDRFRLQGLWDRGDPAARATALNPTSLNPAADSVSLSRDLYSFPARGTAGNWVREFNCPLVGDRADMKRYPQTYDYLQREQFASNLLLPLELQSFGRGVFFLLSRNRFAFSSDALTVALRIREILEPALRASLAADEFVNGRSGDRAETAFDSPPRPGRSSTGAAPASDTSPNDRPHARLQTLDQMQRQHIQSVLLRTNGVIDGTHGAAKVLGLNPSTLRNRMRRLGISRR